jgi:hypothetical protein
MASLRAISTADLPVATASAPGIVEPDNSTITVDGTGKISVVRHLVAGYVMQSGATGVNVGPMLIAPRAGFFTQCIVIVKSSDTSTALTFRIKQNGTDVFSSDPSISAGAATGYVNTFALISSPLPVAAGDVFTIDITSGSANWSFTAQLE